MMNTLNFYDQCVIDMEYHSSYSLLPKMECLIEIKKSGTAMTASAGEAIRI